MNMENQLDNNNFTTSDFYAAAFLTAKVKLFSAR